MNIKNDLFTIINGIHISEKTSIIIKKNNTITLKVNKNTSKAEIKKAVQKLFGVEIKHINTLVTKRKSKKRGQKITYTSNWKKAYVTLKKGQNLPFFNEHK